jgi:XTP/dITP diphosphohydrolase
MASGNRGKLREIARILADLSFTVVPQSDFNVSEADETGDTFVANALIKARHAAAATGLPAIADDSGLAVDALQGRPGVFSARYAGPDANDAANIDKLLNELAEVDDIDRGATFHCVACFVTPDSDDALIAQGSWRGSIARQRSGEGGFGYDPVFIDVELGVTSAQLSAEEKNQRSHRGKALAELARLLGAR